jgi:methylamine utilization protein MauE
VASLAYGSRIVVAFALALAGVLKLRSRAQLTAQLGDFGVPVAAASLIALTLPAIELGIALTLVVFPESPISPTAAIALLALFTGAVLANLARGRRVPCPCFGSAATADPISGRTVLRNAWLLALAVTATGATDGAAFVATAAWSVGLGAVTLWLIRQ